MTDYQKANRPDLAILDALWICKNSISLTHIYRWVCPRDSWISLEALGDQVKRLVHDGLAIVGSSPAGGSVPVYTITPKGHARLIAGQTEILGREPVMRERPQPETADPVVVTLCNAGEPGDKDPAIATLCVDENELDQWWSFLDVEAKADAFVQWSLSNDGSNSHIYIEPAAAVRVPIVGTAGETAEEWKAKAERLHPQHKPGERATLTEAERAKLNARLEEVIEPAKMDLTKVTDGDFSKLLRKHAKEILAVLREDRQRSANAGGAHA